MTSINKAADDWGIQCLRYEIKDITLSAAMKESMAQESMAERTRRAEITRSEGLRQAAINIAEGKKQAVVLESEAARTDQTNRAKGEADAIREVAEAGAASISVLGRALQAPGGQEAAALRVAEQYVESFGKLAKKGNTLIMPAAANDAAGMVAQAMSVYSTMQTSAAGRGYAPPVEGAEYQELENGGDEDGAKADAPELEETTDFSKMSDESGAAALATSEEAAAALADLAAAEEPPPTREVWTREDAPTTR